MVAVVSRTNYFKQKQCFVVTNDDDAIQVVSIVDHMVDGTAGSGSGNGGNIAILQKIYDSVSGPLLVAKMSTIIQQGHVV